MYYEINEEMAKKAKELSSYDNYKIGSETQKYKSVVDGVV